MGPFVPDLLSDEMNLLVALFIGVGFGFVLEQAGFSSSRRLAGLFYGYDCTVLRVFFTAGVTAMAGVLLLAYAGLLDIDAIYVNPLYLWPAVVGGLIMGVGFILGGYCPGTSVCAAAIGKIDAMVFVAGGLAGAYLFAEAYPLYDKFYEGSFMGPTKIYETLGMSQGLFALALIVIAVGAFVMTTWIEKKVNKDAPSKTFPRMKHAVSAAGVIALGVVFVFLPDRRERIMAEVVDASYRQSHPVKMMTADELAFRIVDHDPALQVIDVRTEKEYAAQTLPAAVNIPEQKLFGKEWIEILGQRHKKKVFVADDEFPATSAARLAERLGYENIYVLAGGISGFSHSIMNAPEAALGSDDASRFRFRASQTIAEMIKEAKSGASKVPRLTKKVKGGC